jgi:hypothetical protein
MRELRENVHELIRDICECTIDTRSIGSNDYSTSCVGPMEESRSLDESENLFSSFPNGLAPAFDGCVSVSVAVKCGRGFWETRNHRRSTFVVVRLHPRIPQLVTAVCRH